MAKSGVFERAAVALQIRKGEGVLVALLFSHAFLGGIPLTLTTMSANALFLAHHGAALLPWAYLASAAVVPAAGWLCLRIERRTTFDRFLFTIVGMLCAGDLAAWLSLTLLGPQLGTWALPVWTELEYSLTGLQLWSLAGRALNVQQAKRLFGVIGSGAMLSAGITGLASPFLVRSIGTEQLLLLSASASLVSLLVLRRVCAREQDRLGQDPVVRDGASPAKQQGKIAPELRSYQRAMYALMALAYVSYYVIERVFYDRAEARMPETAELASFLGVLLGVSGLVSLVLRAWLSAQLLARWGLRLGLMALPVLITLGAASATIAGVTLGVGSAVVFWVVAMTRASAGVLRESLDLQAGLMLYQPLPRAQRVTVQTMAEGVVGPLAGGLAGAALLLLDELGFAVASLTLVLTVMAVVWAGVANYLCRAYRRVLEHALAVHRIDPEDLVLGESARGPLLRALDSPWPAEVLYALDMLEEIGWGTEHRRRANEHPSAILKKLLYHGASDVRREALRRIERRAFTELLPDVAALAANDLDLRVRGRAFRVMAAIGDDDAAERIWHQAEPAEARFQREVMTGCLASGCLDRIALAWHELRGLAESADPARRILAAQVLRKVASPAFHRPLLKLLGDSDREVKRAALVACRTIHHPILLPLVVRALGSRPLRAPAAATLIAIGAPALAPLRDFANDEQDWRVRVRALRIASRVKGRRAERLALDLLVSPVEEVRHASLLALVACGHRQHEHQAACFEKETEASQVFEKLLRSEITEATWTLGALRDLDTARWSRAGGPLSAAGGPTSQVHSRGAPSGPGAIEPAGLELVIPALRRELGGSRERILLLLSFLFDAHSMHAARANYASSSTDRRAIVLELLDNALPQALRGQVFPLFDDVAPTQALANMPDEVVDEDAAERGRRGRLKDLLDPERSNVTAWTRVCAIWALPDAKTVSALVDAPDEDIRETARSLLRYPSRRSEGGANMLTVEKVLILRSVQIFQLTPDHILAELAGILKEIDLEPNAEVIKQGDLGDCMFVVVHGAVKVHRGSDVLATLGPRDIVGEMSVLDPEPRSASVTTTAPTRLLRIDRADFYDMMADRIEIAQGVMSVLCQRLRNVDSRSV